MEVVHPRSGKKIKLSRAHQVFARDRETMEEAFPGDIIGLVNPGEFRLGDTICQGSPIQYEGLPQFPPEVFATLRCDDTSRRKQFDSGLRQLVEEGAIQLFTTPDDKRKDFVLAAVGELQFDVVRFRLETEYNTGTTIHWLPYKQVRWIRGSTGGDQGSLRIPYGARCVADQNGRSAILFETQSQADHVARANPTVQFSPVSTPGFFDTSQLKA
jgi:peptide chain release factor 3